MTIQFYNGTMRLDELEIKDSDVNIFGDDIMALIDDYFSCNGFEDSPIQLFSMDELEPDELETFTPINGGQFWTYPVYNIKWEA